MHLRIHKRSLNDWLIFILAFLPFLLGYLPYSCRYLLDLSWCLLFILLLFFRKQIDTRPIRPILYWITAFVLTSAVLYLFHFQSLLNYLWGVRNNFRFYVVFVAVCLFQTEQDAEEYFRILDLLFWVNAVLSLYQFVVLGLGQDNLGGIFGTEVGCNAYSNLFFLIVTSRAVVRFLNQKESCFSCFMKCGTAMLLSALAELKIFYVEFVCILLLLLLINRLSKRVMLILWFGGISVIFTAVLLVNLYPEFAAVMTPQGLLEAALSRRGYTSSGDLNRLTVIPLVNQWFLHEPLTQIFGLGLGNCETSHFTWLNTDFYQHHQYSHYTWLSTAFMYLEMGWIGLIFLFGFFLINNKLCLYKLRNGGNLVHCQIGRVLSLCAPLVLIYNSSLRTEAAYMFFISLAFAHVRKK